MVRAWGPPQRGPVKVSKVQGGRKEGPGLGPAPCVCHGNVFPESPESFSPPPTRVHKELELRATGQGGLQAPPGPLPSRKAVDRARLYSMERTETWYPKGHSGRELPTPRQTSHLDQGQGYVQSLPSGLSSSPLLKGHRRRLSSILACGGWREGGEGALGLGDKEEEQMEGEEQVISYGPGFHHCPSGTRPPKKAN